ncbi:Bug family tripartite tricarboxylate transporter substrate binding protein, partial [Pseudomonas aeruginosa]|uniref:Bug family tripartite tricarboxylate transporter substrate binding protein n=2 Tax=Pseudomonadota TaxID=1224 RepID=UPI00211507CF
AQKLGEQTGQTFIVENRAGGNGVIGADVVSKAPADGYTLLFNASTFTTAPMTMKSVPYEVVRDFTPVALVAKAPLSVAVNKNLPVSDVKS